MYIRVLELDGGKRKKTIKKKRWYKCEEMMCDMFPSNRDINWVSYKRNKILKYAFLIEKKEVSQNIDIINNFIKKEKLNKRDFKKLKSSDFMILFSTKKDQEEISKYFAPIGKFYIYKYPLKYDGFNWYIKKN